MNVHKYAHGPFPQSNSAAIRGCGLGMVSSARLQLGLGRLERLLVGGASVGSVWGSEAMIP